MGLLQIFNNWGNAVIFVIAAYDVIVSQFVPVDIQERYHLGSLGWSWQAWAIIILTTLLLTFIFDKIYLKSNSNQGKTYNKSPRVEGDHHGDNVYGNKITNTTRNIYSTQFHPPPHGYATPTRQELIHKVGVDIQKFREQFKPIRYKHLNDKYDQWLVAKKFFETMRTELLPHANIVLRNTSVPGLFVEIERHLTRYSLQISDQSQAEADRLYHIKHGWHVPRDVINRITEIENTLMWLEVEIDSMINQLVELAFNKGETWWMSEKD